MVERATTNDNGCLLWPGAKNASGYGLITDNHKGLSAHKVAYELFVGPIAKGLVIRHKCDNKACVNIDHLETGTQFDNMQDFKKRGKKSGGYLTGPIKKKTVVERFWDRVKKLDNGCWEWTAGSTTQRYGLFEAGTAKARVRHMAHRFSYELHKGPIPEGMIVRHKCDNPPCVNPAHLELGTHADNVRDKIARGRSNTGPVVKGSFNGQSKLTEEIVEQILNLRNKIFIKSDELAKMFGTTARNIRRILTGKGSWEHVKVERNFVKPNITNNPTKRLSTTLEVAEEIRRKRATHSVAELVKEYGLDRGTIYNILSGKYYKR